jgi:diguanylate cyclase (GGDEF)-like protein
MQLRAKDAEGNITDIPAYPFEILPPWYRRGWAQALWLALIMATIIVGVIALVRRRTLALERRNQTLENKVAARTAELELANARLEVLAHIDGLTGVPNRRHFDVYLAQAWQITQQKSQPIALLIIDVDHFKQYNDHHGHQQGDELLCQIARCLTECLSTYAPAKAAASGTTVGFLARYGGEEFVAVLPNATLAVAKKLAETMRSAVAERVKSATVSVGVSYVQTDTTNTIVTAEQLFSEADNALYAAKAAGRNCVRG